MNRYKVTRIDTNYDECEIEAHSLEEAKQQAIDSDNWTQSIEASYDYEVEKI